MSVLRRLSVAQQAQVGKATIGMAQQSDIQFYNRGEIIAYLVRGKGSILGHLTGLLNEVVVRHEPCQACFEVSQDQVKLSCGCYCCRPCLEGNIAANGYNVVCFVPKGVEKKPCGKKLILADYMKIIKSANTLPDLQQQATSYAET